MARSFQCLFICITLIHMHTEAQWTKVNGPYGGDVKTVASSGSTVYAGLSLRGVFRSTDDGQSWSAANKGIENLNVDAIVIAGSVVYAAVGGTGIAKSTDDGANWTLVTGAPGSMGVTSLAIAGTYLYAGTFDGVFRSSNGGATWKAMNTGLTNKAVSKIAAYGLNVFVLTYGSGIFASADTGATWKAANNGIENKLITGLAPVGSTMYITTSSYGMYKTTDGGATWTALPFNFSLMSATSLSVSGTTMYAAYYGDLFRSTDNGTTWKTLAKMGSGVNFRNINSVAVTPTAIIAGMDINGVFRTTNDGANWSDANQGMRGNRINIIERSGTKLFVGTSQGLFTSMNSGDAWNYVDRDLSSPGMSQLTVATPFLYSGRFASFEVSTDDGATWNIKSSSGLPTYTITDMLVAGPDLLAATDYSGVYGSTDQGATWTAKSTGLTNTAIHCLLANGPVILAGTNAGVFRTTNAGGQWTAANTGFISQVNALTISDSVILAAGPEGVARSTNNGTSWTLVNNGLEQISVTHLTRFGTNAAVSTSNKVYFTSNNGSSWKEVRSDTGSQYASYALKMTDTHVYVAVDGTLWKRSLADLLTTVHTDVAPVPEGWTLEQNFPNPFNPSTTIAFTVPSASPVRLTVCDILGREVAVLHDGMMDAGQHSLRWDAAAVAGGVYIVRMRSAAFTITKKMSLLK